VGLADAVVGGGGAAGACGVGAVSRKKGLMPDVNSKFQAYLTTLRNADEVARPSALRDSTSLVKKDEPVKRAADANPADLNTVYWRQL
jgi:hypothetical protein